MEPAHPAPRPPARTGRSRFRERPLTPSGNAFACCAYNPRTVSVRDPGYDPRQNHPRSGARPAAASPERRSGRSGGGSTSGGSRTPGIIGAVVVIVLLFAVGLGFGSGFFGGARSTTPGTAALSSAEPTVATDPTDASETEGSGEPTDAESAPPDDGEPVPSEEPAAAPPLAETDVAFVPVINFRSARLSVKASEIEALATGGSPFKALVLVEADADGILAKLGISRDDLGKKLVTVDSAEALAKNLAKNRARVAFLRADDVGPSVRALAWGGKHLFGGDRLSLAKWPLIARLSGPETPEYNPGAAWTLFAGGDILLDRGVSLAIQAGGVNYPFNGGTAKITSLCRDCSPMGWDLPNATKTGNAGAVRDLIKGADLAIANFENPAPNAFRLHSKGTTFSANPKHIA